MRANTACPPGGVGSRAVHERVDRDERGFTDRLQRDWHAATRGAFDDQLMFLTASELLDPLFRDGSLKSPQCSVPAELHVVHSPDCPAITW